MVTNDHIHYKPRVKHAKVSTSQAPALYENLPVELIAFAGGKVIIKRLDGYYREIMIVYPRDIWIAKRTRQDKTYWTPLK